jgi:hypothetical protein
MNSSQGQKPGPAGTDWEDDDEPWRHPPVRPEGRRHRRFARQVGVRRRHRPLEGDPEKAKKPRAKPTKKP